MARFLCATMLCLLGMEISTALGSAFSSREAPGKASDRTLTFIERVAYQRAIEEVYWRHRIWPKENPGRKPSIDAIISQRQIEQKVEDYLRKSQFVMDQRGSPITPTELQAEMDRIAQHTKRPEMLRELFAALGNDALLTAECLARPTVAERLAVSLADGRPRPPVAPNANSNIIDGSAAPPYQGDTTVGANSGDAVYKLPEISVAMDCTADSWTATSVVKDRKSTRL